MKAPFPWFGGKRRIAHLVWDRFGDVPNYVEPFAGSLAVLLARPHEPRCETVNDSDCYLANFWRAVTQDAKAVARHADWPVNEADLHARHKWLVTRAKFRERMLTDPNYFDVKVAGWWVWGLSAWIGGEWCAIRGRPKRRKIKLKRGTGGGVQTWQKRPSLKRGGVGVQRVDNTTWQQRPMLNRPNGVQTWRRQPTNKAAGVHRQMPDVSGNSGAYGRGVHQGRLVTGLENYFEQLQERLRRVRVCCGDFERVLSYSPTTAIGMTAVLLDPPYPAEAKRDSTIYAKEDLQVAHRAHEWAVANGNDPLLRIAFCGYEGTHIFPDNWTVIAWESNGGYANRESSKGKDNRKRERIWFSPHCLSGVQDDLFNLSNSSELI